VILCGCKRDLRDDPETAERLAERHESFVAFEEAVHVAKDIDAVTYMECSALTQQNLKDVFDEAIRVVINPPNGERDEGGKCVLQ
jgi:Ras-related C3 botulinum toxin substrate 1